MTNEQRNQVAAMNASGMSIDEIIIATGLGRRAVTDFVAERNALNNAKKQGRGYAISAQTKQAIVEWYQSGHSVGQTAKKFGIDPKTVKGAIKAITGVEVPTAKRTKETAKEPTKEKEPTAAATATDSKEKIVQVQNTTSKSESQALRGVEVIGLMQTMLIGIEENFGDNVEVMSLRADNEQAHIMFRYGGKDYALSFGLAF